MTDEELFKAWKSEQYKDQSTEERLEFVEHLHTFPKYFEKTFLAGLKAGRPQWHDLRKDPNDLPYMETELLCQKSSGRCFVGYYADDNKFHSHETGKSYDIIRWMDIGIWWNIPTFDKE